MKVDSLMRGSKGGLIKERESSRRKWSGEGEGVGIELERSD